MLHMTGTDLPHAASWTQRLGPWLLLWLAPWAAQAEPNSVSRWAVYYSAAAPADEFLSYDLVVFDADAHPALPPLTDRGVKVLGYVSVGEVASYRRYFKAVRTQGLLLDENPNWSGSFAVDLRDQRWTTRLVSEIVPAILQQGFHGIFIDTLDQPLHLETTSPSKFKGMRNGAVQLIRELRRRYPGMVIMVNRGYQILPEIASSIDIALGESVRTTYDFATKRYRRVSDSDYAWQVQWLRKAKAAAPTLQLFTLDYWDPSDTANIAAIYAQQRAAGFVPYVATIELNRLIPEPAPP